ncbi:LysE family translocator [Nocardiopsis rhodophaea]|uniref:LysE family translocator n=1 Tax=Nocardiopsis rhodophaea TaxID=280238 RepID=UPI0031DEA872
MPTITTLLTFAATAAVIILIPGPSVFFVVGRALAHGQGVALRSAAGNALGELVLVGAVAVGVGAVIAKFGVVFTALKLIGATYLVYLGVQAILNRRELASSVTGASPSAADGGPGARALWDGFIVGATNPKSLIFFIAALPQFVEPGQGA